MNTCKSRKYLIQANGSFANGYSFDFHGKVRKRIIRENEDNGVTERVDVNIEPNGDRYVEGYDDKEQLKEQFVEENSFDYVDV